MDATLDKKLLGYKQIAQQKLEHIFAFIIGQKDIVIEPNLIKPLEFVCGVSWLRSKGIDKIFKFDTKVLPVKTKQIVYLIPSDLLIFKHVLDQISTLHKASTTEDLGFKEYHVIFIPNVFSTFSQLLEEEGLHDIVSIYRFSWDFIVLDRNVLSLEIQNVYKDLYVKNDTKLLSSIASSLKIFNMVHKRPSLVLSYGEYSETVLNMVERMENFRRSSYKDESKDISDFTAMLVIDRNKDYPSCLMTPVVYSGLLLELFEFNASILTVNPSNNKIKAGKIEFLEVPPRSQPETSKKETVTLKMGGQHDEVYSNNKYRHFSDVVNLLSVQSKALGMEGSKYTRTMNLSEMKQYVEENLPKLTAQKKLLLKHLVICEQIVQELGCNFEKLQNIEENMLTNSNKKQTISYLEEHLAEHKYNVLRLLCLFHVTIGLPPDETMKFMTNYLNIYGFKYLHIFQNLHTAKLFPDTLTLAKPKVSLNNLTPQQLKRTPFQIEMNKLKLIPADPNVFTQQNENSDQQSIYASSTSLASSTSASPSKPKKDAASPSYVFSGNFIPMIAQLSNFLLKAESIADLNSKMGHLDIKARLFGAPAKSIREYAAEIKKGDVNHFSKVLPLRPRTLFIFMVGGITYAEIAACNLVEVMTGSKIVLASDKIICGEEIVKSAF